MGPSHDDVEAKFIGCELKGDFIDSMSEKGEFILDFQACKLEGAISTGVAYHPLGEPEEAKWWLIGTVDHSLAPNDNETGIQVTLDGASEWTVTKTSFMNALTIAEGAQIAAPAGKSLTATNYGEPIDLAPGKYEGKILLTIA